MTFWTLLLLYAVSLAGAFALARARLAYADAGARYPALHTAKYLLGSFLAVTIALIIFLLASAAACTEGARSEGTLIIKDACSATRRWYAVLTDWQSGIGAFVGLLGLAWSTLLNALMEKSDKTEGN